jgi:hypothetical protein
VDNAGCVIVGPTEPHGFAPHAQRQISLAGNLMARYYLGITDNFFFLPYQSIFGTTAVVYSAVF